ncbi:MAG: HAD hydrolase family protein, partial [Mycoplasma sp.]
GFKLNYLSCLSGNIVYDIKNKEVIHSNWIEESTCKAVYKLCRRNIMAFMPYVKALNGKRILNYMWYKKYNPIEAYKINVFASVINLGGMKRFYNELRKLPGIEILTTHRFFYEIVKEGSDKGFALDFLLKRLNINRKESAAIGDSFNDVPSFKVAGSSFLIKPSKKLNKFATHVIKVKKNRIAKVLNEYFY